MTTRIRAKFRCLSIGMNWNHGYWNEAMLRPVWNKGNSEENKKFWEASPSGELYYGAREALPFVGGRYYYIDMEPIAEKLLGAWVLDESHARPEGKGGVVLRACDMNAHLKIELTVPRVLEAFGKPGGFWSVVFTEAPDDPA